MQRSQPLLHRPLPSSPIASGATARRRVRGAVLCAAALAVVAACGGDDTPASDDRAANDPVAATAPATTETTSAETTSPQTTGAGAATTSPSSAATDTTSTDAAFPVTITHGQGTVTIAQPPERVVTLGVADAQIARALGAEIVGATRNVLRDDGNWAGVDPPLDPDVTVLDEQVPNLEQLAALEPDLILATTSQPTYSEAYDELSDIAPVISYKTAPLGDSGEELMQLIGEALGEPELAEELITASEQQIAAFVEANPDLAGATYAFGQYFDGALQLFVGADTPSAQFFGTLGLSVPDELAALEDGTLPPGFAAVSAERFDVLDSADVALLRMFGPGAEEAFLSSPLVPALRLQQDGALHIISQDLTQLLFAPNPAVTGAILTELEPLLTPISASR